MSNSPPTQFQCVISFENPSKRDTLVDFTICKLEMHISDSESRKKAKHFNDNVVRGFHVWVHSDVSTLKLLDDINGVAIS